MTGPRQIDLRGMRCPGPIVRLNTEINSVEPGTALRIIASDPAFEPDVKAWCRRTGHELVQVEQGPDTTEATVRRRA